MFRSPAGACSFFPYSMYQLWAWEGWGGGGCGLGSGYPGVMQPVGTSILGKLITSIFMADDGSSSFVQIVHTGLPIYTVSQSSRWAGIVQSV